MQSRLADPRPPERLPPTCPLPKRWSRADGQEDIARICLGAGSPIDAAIGRRLSELRSLMRGNLVVVLERPTGASTPEPDPILRVGDALFFVGPPGRIRAAVGP
ncbi:MAG: TrkA C-terminal domain-containing protein [Alphaproteobacteria bacterium]|nr:TrkA C-terminal domain-containing protein [Alphaproteobacteria bacterium]MCB9792817.1 TrkA C-terminal domain-containing protein [Alphaproteobacteria bacterium]